MTFNFSIPNRYDPATAEDGVWTDPILDEYDNSWGDFKLRMYDSDNPAIKKAQEKVRVKNAKEIRMKKLDADKAALEVFLTAMLLDWKDVKDEKGKAVPFSIEAARAYFGHPQVFKFVFPSLMEFAGEVRNFADEGATLVDKDEVLGN